MEINKRNNELIAMEQFQITSSSGQVVAVVETTAFILINVITFYVFVNRPFLWADGTIARFMY